MRKFYEKARTLFKNTIASPKCDYKAPPTRETIFGYWDKMAEQLSIDDVDIELEDDIVFTMPWEYMEFMLVFNGVKLSAKRNTYGLWVAPECGYPLYNGDEAEIIESINKEEGTPGIFIQEFTINIYIDTFSWVVVAHIESGHFALLLNCDKTHPDFGIVSRYELNIGCGEHDTLPSFAHFIRDMYLQ